VSAGSGLARKTYRFWPTPLRFKKIFYLAFSPSLPTTNHITTTSSAITTSSTHNSSYEQHARHWYVYAGPSSPQFPFDESHNRIN
jgi:hypothetical protein